ncbi:hypothetical protein LTS15_006814 [Exophiala xenobiotica]|nr:hypothetical protein LTS15_006814 [Exophiala xenobiotica]
MFEGYDQEVMSVVNISPSYIDLVKIGDSSTGTITQPTKQGGIVAIYYIGTLVGALMGGAMSDKFGRRKAIFFGGIWGLFGQSMQVAAQNANWMLCARLLAGVGTGSIGALIPVWGSELVAHNARGMVMAFETFVNFAGISTSYWLEYGLSFVKHGHTQVRWRFPLGFQMIFLAALMAIIPFMPESPRWDIGNGRQERGIMTLAIFRARGEIDHPAVQSEFKEIVAAVELEAEYPARTYFHMVTGINSSDLHLGRRTFLAAWLQIMQAWTGVTSVVVYAPTLFRIAGFSGHKADLLTGCANVVAMVCCVFAYLTIDRYGRRKVLIAGGFGQSLSFFILGALSKVYPTEIFPLATRSRGNAFGIVGWSLGCGSVSLATPPMFKALGPQGFFNLAAVAMVYCFYPETSCSTLEEIDLLFASKSPFVWETERNFKELKLQHSALVHGMAGEKSGGAQVEEAEAVPEQQKC